MMPSRIRSERVGRAVPLRAARPHNHCGAHGVTRPTFFNTPAPEHPGGHRPPLQTRRRAALLRLSQNSKPACEKVEKDHQNTIAENQSASYRKCGGRVFGNPRIWRVLRQSLLRGHHPRRRSSDRSRAGSAALPLHRLSLGIGINPCPSVVDNFQIKRPRPE